MQMFKSATLKLTVWYALILISICLLFSIVIYIIAIGEVGSRIDRIEQDPIFNFSLNSDPYETFRERQVHAAESNLVGALVITNIFIWSAGAIGSYYLARQTLRPIERAHTAQSRFTSDASHELRTPLASMKIELEVALRDKHLTQKEMRAILVSNLEEVEKLTTLSQTLLQLSRLDHAGIERTKVALAPIIQTVSERFAKTAGRKIIIKKSRPLFVMANDTHIEELLTILIDNAVKYSPPKTSITIELLSKRSMAGFRIVNRGKGISAEELPHIFDRFYRTDTSRTNNSTRGYGLGLALAKKIVSLHEGELTVSSAANRDTVFTALFPKTSASK